MAASPAPALSRLRLLAHSLTSVIDQAWLSALNLLLGLVLIRWATKDDYGLYAQLYVAGLFAVSMTESVLINPLTTLAPRLSAAQRERFIVELATVQRYGAWGLGLVFGGGAYVILRWQDIAAAAPVALAFGGYVTTTAWREFQRGLGFVRGQPGQVLRTDLIFGGLVLAGVATLVLAAHTSLPAVLLVLTVANLVAWWLSPAIARLPARARARRAALARIWRRGRLGLPGALSSWLANYSYLYLAAAWLGVAAAADLNAARLLLMPISLLVVAWSRVARPQLSHHLHHHQRSELTHLLVVSCVALTTLAGLYLGILWWALPWLQHTILGPDYATVQGLVLPWGLYFVLYTLHLVGAATMLSADRYPQLLTAAVSSLVVLALALVVLLPSWGTVGAIYALALVEVYNLVLLLVWFLPGLWRPARPGPSS